MRANWSKRLLWGVFAGLAVLGLVWFAWPAPVAVDLAVVTKGPMEVTVHDDGKTHVRHIYTVSAPIAGKVLRISHPSGEGGISRHVGDEVAANDTVVAVMQPTTPGFVDLRSNTHVANGITYALQYDVVSDFEPIALLVDAPLLFLGKKDLPANSLKELIGWLKENPDKASMGSTGVGGPGHLLALLLQEKTGTRFNLVPYRGVNPSVQDLIAGQIDMTISNTATAMPHVRAGRVKAFAVTTQDRIAIAPEIPSVEEAGFSWLQFSLWAGLFAPKGTPRDFIDKLNAAAVGTTHDPAMRQKLVDQGFVIPPRERQTPEALGAYQKAEIAKWWPIIKAANIKGE